MDRSILIGMGIFLMFLLMNIPKEALGDVGKICIDNSTLEVNTTYETAIDGNVSQIEISKRVSCIYGCSDNGCNEGSMLNKTTFPIFLGISGLFVAGGIILNRWLFGFGGGSLLIITGLILTVQGLSLSEPVTQNLLTNGFGITMMLIGLWITAMSVMNRDYSK
jgi:hypothetical protein